jgi:UDP-N-acetylmuramate dehydrogenase
MQIEEHIPLAPLTTFKIGGKARFFVRVQTIEELKEALAFAQSKQLKFFILGGGSNILVPDEGLDALVIKIDNKGIEEKDELLIAQAGEEWDNVVSYANERGLWGIENLSGIPGSTGAAPVQNIGAYGTELKDTLHFVDAFDTKRGEIVRFSNEQCEFGYRTSLFKKNPGHYCIMRVGLRLSKTGKPNLSYKDLQPLQNPSLREVREVVIAIRRKKFPDLSQEGTAGSFFLNPVVTEDAAAQLKKKYPLLPQFAATGGIKISLAWLLDNVLNMRGKRHGNVRLFENQPLVVVAQRGARATEVRGLMAEVMEEVMEAFGIALEPEVQIL